MLVTASTVYSAAQYWLPLITIVTLVYRAYRKAANGVGVWADKLMSNHLHHIQENTQKTAELLAEVRDNGNKNIELTLGVAETLKQRTAVDDRIQAEIARDLAILKDR